MKLLLIKKSIFVVMVIGTATAALSAIKRTAEMKALTAVTSGVEPLLTSNGQRQRNLTHIRIAAETWQPFFLISRDEKGDAVYSGIMWDLLMMLTARMNIRFDIVRPTDGLWGVELPNGSWNGMLGMIQRKEADMALGPFAISHPRTKVAAFPPAIFVFPHWLFLSRPKGSSDLSDFVRLFHPNLWIAIFCTGILISFVVWIASRFESSISIQSKKPSVLVCLLNIWGILYQESIVLKSRGLERFLMYMWVIGTLVLMRTYSGLLIASLTVPSVPIPIRSLEDLVQQSDVPWRLEQGGIILHTFKSADVKMYKTLLEGSEGFFPDCYAARKEIADGRFAGICDSLSGNLMVTKTFSASGKCDYFTPRETIVTHSYTLVLQRNSPYMKNLRFWLQELQERGWVDQLVNRVVNNGTLCRLPPGKEEGNPPAKPLNIGQVWGIFAILATGLLLAALGFVAEVFIRF